MKSKSLKSWLDRLNNNKAEGLCNLRPLSSTVDFAKVWAQKPKPSDAISYPDGPYHFYFIKNGEGTYVAAVLDMNSDLHWFVAHKHRGKGYLTNSMKKTILFHLFQEREEQTITIDKDQISNKNFHSSEKVALSLGFTKTDNKNYLLTNEKYKTDRYLIGLNTEITKDRINDLKKQVNYLGRSLWVIQTEIEMKLGDTDYAGELKELVDVIKEHTDRLEDAWWDSKNKSPDTEHQPPTCGFK